MKIYENTFLKLESFEEHKLIELIWLAETKNMTEKQYKEDFLNILQLISKLRPNKIMSDATDLQFIINVDLQEWTNQNHVKACA
jgi:alpha-L-fucosidase